MSTTTEKEIRVASGLGDADASQVLEGTTFSSETGFNQEGKFKPIAENIAYDNTESGLAAENTQQAIDKIDLNSMATAAASGESITVQDSV